MKRILVSLALGLLIVPLLLGVLLFWKIFWPTTLPLWLFWLAIWPYYFLCRLGLLVGIPPEHITTGKVIIVGVLGDYLFFSFLIYGCLRLRARFLKRTTPATQLPPPPELFH